LQSVPPLQEVAEAPPPAPSPLLKKIKEEIAQRELKRYQEQTGNFGADIHTLFQ
jgi:hypothetical protein